jgi:hypothetical protein
MSSMWGRLFTVLLLGVWPFMYHAAFGRSTWDDIGVIVAFGGLWMVALLVLVALVQTNFPITLQAPITSALAVSATLFFCYGFLEAAAHEYLNYWLPFRYLIGAWLALVIAGAVLAGYLAKNQIFMWSLTGLGFFLILGPLMIIATNWEARSKPIEHGSADKPNVYFFVFDAYGRADQMREVLGFDNRPILRFLMQNGFRVSSRSNTNYPITDSSFTSVLSMEYHTGFERYRQPWPWQLGLWKSAVLKGNGPVARKFRSMGYGYVHAEGNYSASRCGGVEDLCVRGKSLGVLDNAIISILKMTPLVHMIKAVYPGAIQFEPIEFNDVIRSMPDFPPGPKFVYGHICMPHDADRYPDCGKRQRMSHGPEASLENDPTPYVDTIRCVNRQLRQMLPRLLERDPTAVIVIQSDHGFVLKLKPFADWTEAEINHRYGNLSAMRLPERCRAMVPDDMTPVNTFRIVFACLERRAADLLPDQSYAIWYNQREPARLLRKY